MAKKISILALVLGLLFSFTLSSYSALPVSHAATRLTVQRDASTPSKRYITACEQEAGIFRLKFGSDLSDVQVTDLYLFNIDPVTRRVTNGADGLISSLVLDYGNGKKEATLNNGMVHFGLGSTSDFIVREDSTQTVTISANFTSSYNNDILGTSLHLATVPEAASGGTLDPTDSSNYVSGTVDGVRAIFVVNGLTIEPGQVSGQSNDFAIVKSRPVFIPLSTGSNILIPGAQQDIYRFSILAQGCDDAEIGSLSFDMNLSNVTLQNITLYDLNNTSVPLNSVRPSLSGSGKVTLALDINTPSNGETVSRDTPKQYALRADVTTTNTPNTQTLSTRIAAESSASQRGTYASLSGNSSIVWSDHAATPHGLTSPASADWMTGRLFNELPSEYFSLSDSAVATNTSLNVAVSGNTSSTLSVPSTSKIATFQLGAQGGTVYVYQLKLHRSGNGSASDFANVWIENNGQRLTNRQTINTDNSVTLLFDSPLVLSAGTTVNLDVVAGLNTSGGGKQNAVGFVGSADFISSAGTVGGSFPVNGPLITFTSGSSNSNANLNSNANSNTNLNGNTNVNGTVVEPLIESIEGPPNLTINQEGTWKIKTNGTPGPHVDLNIWWDDVARTSFDYMTSFSGVTKEFKHRYAQPGIYRIQFFLTDRDQNIVDKEIRLVRVSRVVSTIPPALFLDLPYTSFDNFLNPFNDTALLNLTGTAAAELFRRGILDGYENGSFQASMPVNRAEILKMLSYAVYGSDFLTVNPSQIPQDQNPSSFPDIAPPSWYVGYVRYMFSKGVIQGYPDGFFHPERTVNTVEFLKMMTLTFGLEKNLPYTYADVKSTDWFTVYAGIAQKYDLFPERREGLLPGKELTRGEVAIALYQYFKNRLPLNP